MAATLFVVAGCSSDPATAIEYSPRSSIVLDSATAVVRVYGSTGELAFCREYVVDEAAPPGDTLSLVGSLSTLVLAPDGLPKGSIRIVSEIFEGSSFPVGTGCPPFSSARPKPLVKKVAVVGYAEGRRLALTTNFDAACLGVDTCDEATSTCERGVCVSADVRSADGAVAASGSCFDLASCPTLKLADRIAEPCTFRVPRPMTEGYFAITFAVETASNSKTKAIAVLDPRDVRSLGPENEGERVELVGAACTLASRAEVADVYFGYSCSPPEPHQQLCTNGAGPSTSSAAAVLIDAVKNAPSALDAGSKDATVEGGAPDGTTSDAAIGDGASPDAADGVGPDAASDGGADGSGDAQSSGGDSGADTGGGGNPGAGPECPAGSGTYCGVGSGTVCCLASTTCTTMSACQGTRATCDDQTDCAPGQECCRTISGPYISAACVTTGTCRGTGTAPQVLCSPDDSTCPLGSTCERVRIDDSSLRYGCVPSVGIRDVACPLGSPGAYCSNLGAVCCEVDPGPQQSSCVSTSSPCGTATARRWTCDDASDCPIGDVCCIAPSEPRTSYCATRTDCNDVIGSVYGCSSNDTRCPNGFQCGPTNAAAYGQLQRLCESAR